MAARDQILEMLASGLSSVQVASAIGVSDSYVSQLLGDEDFAAEVEAKKVQSAAEDLEYDHKIDSVEATFLDRIEAKAPLANLQQSLQAFAVLNKAKRRKDTSTNRGASQVGTVVNLQLNVNLIPQYLVNGKQEIVEVEGKSMISATATKLDEILALRRGEDLGKKRMQLPGITKVERAAGVLEVLENKPVRRAPKMLTADMDVSNIL